jgi:hypothetical protein
LGFEQTVLAGDGTAGTSLWLDVDRFGPYKGLSGRYVVVDATLDARSHGHFGVYSATLRNVERIVESTPERELNAILGAMTPGK